MTKESTNKPNLSIVGDLSLKWAAMIAGATVFAAFAEKIINGLHNFLGLSFHTAYVLFICLYFILIAVAIILFVAKQNQSSASGNFNRIVIIAALLLTLCYWKLFPLFFVRGLAKGIGVAFLLVSIGLIVAYAGRRNRRIIIEYGLVTLLGILTFYQYFFKKTPPEADPDTGIFNQFNLRKNVQDNLSGFSKHFRDSAMLLADEFGARTMYRTPAFNSKQGYPYLFKDTAWADSLFSLYEHVNSYCLALYAGKTDSSSITLDSIKAIRHRYYNHLDSSIQHEITRGSTGRQFDTASFLHVGARVYNYNHLAQSIGYRIQSFERKLNARLVKQWLDWMKFIQYKGLLFLSIFLFILFTQLYRCRIRLNQLQSNDSAHQNPPKGIRKATRLLKPFIIRFAPGRSRIRSPRIITRTDNENTDTEEAARANEGEIAHLNAYGNQLKNFIFSVVLLMIPFFSTNTEENTNLDKPFLNFSIEDLVKPYVPDRLAGRSDEKESPGNSRNISGGQSLTRMFYGDTVYGDAAHTTVNSPFIYTPTTNVYPIDSTGAVLKALRELGKRTILDTGDRRQFLDGIDNAKNGSSQ